MFLDHAVHAVDLVDEQHVLLVQIGQNAREIRRAFQHGPGRHLDFHAEFMGDDIGHRGFAQAGRAVQDNVVHRLVAMACGLDGNPQMRLHLFLPDHIVKPNGPKPLVALKVVALLKLGICESFVHTRPSLKCA